MRISDANLGGSYLTMLASASNFGDEVAYSVGLYVLEYLSYTTAAFLFWALGLIFIFSIKEGLF